MNSLPGEQGLLEGQFEEQIRKALPSILEPLAEIAAIPSDTAEQVKRKEQIFARRFSPALKRFAATGELWSASLLANGAASIPKERYEMLLGSINSKKRFDALTGEDWAQECLAYLGNEDLHCFHWELAFPQVFLAALANGGKPGFNVIIGNPPYDVLAEKESGSHVASLKKYVAHDPALTPSRVGKNNLYKIFICRALELLSEGGCLSFIVPMPLLGDEQACGVRKALLDLGAFSQIHAFPQKDNPTRRVFYDAKLSTALFVYWKGREDGDQPAFVAAVHPAQFIEPESPSLRLSSLEVGLYDPSNLTIVSCAQDDWDIATQIMKRPGMSRLGNYCNSYQGEVNETTQRDFLREHDGPGRRLVLRGSNVCLYVLREASQGEPLYVDVQAFREGKRRDSKAFHGLIERIGFQRGSPQNNFRRVIAAQIPGGELCFDTVSYVPNNDSATRPAPDFLLALLNSKLIDWYFRLGSTNSKVNKYQFINLPCPVFRDKPTENEKVLASDAQALIDSEPSAIPKVLESCWSKAPFSPAARDVLGQLAARISTLEEQRGTISRQDRSHLWEEAQAHQDAIDVILFRMAGLSAKDIAGIEERLAAML